MKATFVVRACEVIRSARFDDRNRSGRKTIFSPKPLVGNSLSSGLGIRLARTQSVNYKRCQGFSFGYFISGRIYANKTP